MKSLPLLHFLLDTIEKNAKFLISFSIGIREITRTDS